MATPVHLGWIIASTLRMKGESGRKGGGEEWGKGCAHQTFHLPPSFIFSLPYSYIGVMGLNLASELSVEVTWLLDQGR